MSLYNEISLNKRPEIQQIELLSPERTMEIVLDALRDLVDYELAVVMRLETPDRLVVRKAVGPLNTPRLDGYSISLSQRRDIARLLEQREPKLFGEHEEHLDTYYDVLDLPDGHSCLVAPLYIESTPIGLLTLDHRACNRFSPAIVRFISTISKLISVSMAQSDTSRSLIEKTKALTEERNRLLNESADAFRDLVGVSAVWRRVLDAVRLVAVADVPVLLTGETGTGKEQVARKIHQLSHRASGPFVAVNCSALVSSLAESELFGHEKGAFSGAVAMRRGRFELADGGTLFLDEIGDLPLELQPKLLRVLQDGKFERVGGERSVSADVRIIAATNIDLESAIAAGTFREDLWYRLHVFPIHLPPLRERDEDAALLAEYFVSQIRRRPGFESLALSPSAIERILATEWRGNVRELRNAIERAAILARGGSILAEHLAPTVNAYRAGRGQGPYNVNRIAALASTGVSEPSSTYFPPLEDALRAHILAALKKSGGKIYGANGAASLLGMKPTTLQSKMKKLGIRSGIARKFDASNFS